MIDLLIRATSPAGEDPCALGESHPRRPGLPRPSQPPPTPHIAGDAFRKGCARKIIEPGLWGRNDHTFFVDAAGRIHCLGIATPYRNPQLFHAVADDWQGPFHQVAPIPKAPGEVGMWAPGAIVKDGIVYVFYTDPRGIIPWRWTDRWSLNLITATIDRPYHWQHHGPQFTGFGHIRDPMIVHDQESGLYLIYFHRTNNGGRTSSVSFRTSTDLRSWSAETYDALAGLQTDLPGGCAESPHVFLRNGWFYLLVTHTSRQCYARTRVWASRDPFWFGRPDDAIVALWAHAPEVISVAPDRWLITHAGHRLHAGLAMRLWRFRTPGIECAELLWS